MVDIKHFFLFILSFIQFQIINIYIQIYFSFIIYFYFIHMFVHYIFYLSINADIFLIYLFN